MPRPLPIAADTPATTPMVHPLAHLAHSLRGFHTGSTLDPRYFVFEPHAFRGLQPTELYERALRLVAGRRASAAAGRRGPVESPLPRVICGAPSASAATGSCGFLLTTKFLRGKRYYTSGTCDRRHHATSVPQHLEHVVRQMVEAVFSESNLARSVDRVVERSHAVRHDLRVMERELARAQALYERMARLEADASLADDTRNFEHYRDERLRYQTERDQIRDAAAALRVELEGHRSADDVRLILQESTGLARDLHAFFDALQDDIAGTRQLLGLLTRTIRVRNLTGWLAAVEIEFTHGARATHVFLTETFRSGHGERVWARARLATGTEPRVVTQELKELIPMTSGDCPHTVDRTLTLALVNQWFEPETLRIGPLERLECLATRLHVPVEDVRSAFVRGLLGPGAVLSTHEIAVAPTEDELRAHVRAYQKRRIALAMHWPIDDTVAVAALGQELGLPAKLAPSALVRGRMPRATDEFGRVFSRRSLIEPKLLTWLAQFRAQHSDRLRKIRLDSVRAAGVPDRFAGDFHLLGPLSRALVAQVGYPGRSLFNVAARRGDILMIPLVRTATKRDHIGCATHLVYCPPNVVRSHDRSVVEHWIRGGYPLPTDASGRGAMKPRDAARRKGRRPANRPRN